MCKILRIFSVNGNRAVHLPSWLMLLKHYEKRFFRAHHTFTVPFDVSSGAQGWLITCGSSLIAFWGRGRVERNMASG